MMYGYKYDADYDILILSCICYAMLFLSILFYYSAILATTSINACINMKTLKLLIKTSFCNKIINFMCFNIIK